MRNKTALTALALITAFPFAGCSKSPAAPKPQETPVAAAPTPAAPAPETAAASPATDQSIADNVGDPVKFHELMTSLQQAAQKHDPSAIAPLIRYPIDINPNTKKVIHIRTPEVFIAQYNNIITPHIADIIAKQKYDDLFVSYRGAMFGDGEVWITGICKDKGCKQTDIKISTIQNTSGGSNQPPHTAPR